MEGLAELHTHLGGSVASDILWSLAHEQGIALPVKDFWEFDRLVTVSDPRGVANLDALDAIYHWTELIQSSPLAVERSVHAAIGEVVEVLRPDRIGHGILAAGDGELMGAIADAGIVLEICPTSNLLTKALPDEDTVRDVFRTFVAAGVPFTVSTDGPEMMRTHLRDELELLERIGALDLDELDEANRRGHEASFLAAASVRSGP